jgi:hypothetical protein
MPTSEPELREMLRRRADAFSMDPVPPRRVVDRSHRRRSRKVALGAAVCGSLGLIVALVVGSIGASTAPDAPSVASGSSPTSVKLVSYLLPDTSVGEPGSNADQELNDHIACMRAQGFDIPDPVRTADGWTIAVDPSVVDVGSDAWREAAFVTCRLPLPASGNFILGLSKERVDRFVACVSEQGFDLPEPTMIGDGEYVFDLTSTDIDMNAPEWNRAAFVTCSPDVGP